MPFQARPASGSQSPSRSTASSQAAISGFRSRTQAR